MWISVLYIIISKVFNAKTLSLPIVCPFQYYDDAARSRNSTFLKEDIRDLNTVDERFFEVVENTDGTYKLRSALDPSKLQFTSWLYIISRYFIFQ